MDRTEVALLLVSHRNGETELRYVQRHALGFALDLEEELAVALEVVCGVHDADIAVVVGVDHALVSGDETKKAGGDHGQDLKELHLDEIGRNCSGLWCIKVTDTRRTFG